MKQGFICLHRKMLEWEWHDDPLTGWLWVNLLLLAQYADTKYRGVELKRGQVYATSQDLMKLTGLTYQQLRTRLANLEKCGNLTKKATNKYSIITICNYDTYQDLDCVANQQTTNNQPTTNQQTTSNIVNNNNNNNNIYPPIAPPRGTPSKPKEKVPKGWYLVPEEYRAFEAAFTKWLQYKAERKQTYKSNASLTQCLKRLVKLSNNNPETALLIVEQSMANNWAGLFKLKNDDEYNRTNNQAERNQQLYDQGASLIAQQLGTR